LRFDPPRVRVARLTESLAILKAFFAAEGPVTLYGQHYQVDGLRPGPMPPESPVLRRGPPILIAGTRPGMLRLAAREADIVGLEDHQFAERATGSTHIRVADADQQVAIVREAAGARYSELELSVFAARTEVTDDRRGAIDRLAAQLQLSPAEIEGSQSFLLGSVEAIVDQLQERRARLGISYIMVFARVMDAFAPIVARLASK
jgi:alkanesulfonate monooxygenase SsuD/methylene tetrahydromethanopterin reductase-like flavin-dependent oxidoreductase (luciferase family)